MAQIKLNPAPARQFLEALYGRFFSQDKGAAYLEVRGKKEGGPMSFRRFYRSPGALLKDMGRWGPGLNYWIGVGLRKDTKGGAKVNLLALTAAFADVDVGKAGHKGAVKYQTKDEALAAIEAFPLRPSLVIDSGGGFQPYWLFREAVPLTQEIITRLEGINRGLAQALGADLAATDAARILRLPGTFNMKLTGKPRPVKIIWCEPDRVYDLGAFEPYEAQGKKTAGRDARPTRGAAAGEPGGDFTAYAQKALAEELVALAGTPEGSRNARLNQAAFALGQLVGAGVLDRGQVEAALSGAAAGIGLGDVEARATIRSGLDSGIKEPRSLPEPAQEKRKGARQGKGPGSPGEGPPGGQGGPEAEKIWLVGHCYFVDRGRLCLEVIDREGRPDARPLANFQARIMEEITRDDGLKAVKEFRIAGELDTGRPLPPATVAAEKFDSLNWIKANWGAGASVAPGRSLGPHLVNGIQAHSQGFKRRTVYGHTGWRKIGGVWRYLHGGGALGPGEPVEVDLGSMLDKQEAEKVCNYRLPEPGGLEAAQASLKFLDVAAWEITAPLLACAYLAPFADLLKVNFSLWLYGPTSSKKTTLAALALSHFGIFDYCSLPFCWESTINSLEKVCFALKDSMVVLDDFKPPGGASEAQANVRAAARLIYNVGNRSGRGRLAPDLSAKPIFYPRGLVVITGEMLLPGQRQSATARYLGIEFDLKKTPIDEEVLTEAQEEAASALYSAAMSRFLSDLAPNLEGELEKMRAAWQGNRAAFQNGGHARIPETLAWLAVGFEVATGFFVRQGAISGDQGYEMNRRAWKVFQALGEKHSRIIEGERPTLKFLEVLNELFLTSKIYAEHRDYQGGKPPQEALLGWQGLDPAHNAYLVGYADEEMVYLLAETAYRAVAEAVRGQGDYLGFGKNEMLKALAREGLIEPDKNGENTRNKYIQGGSKRVIWLPRKHLGHDQAGGDEEA